MSTTITYNGSTIAQVNNETKTLLTSGKWLTGNIILTDTSESGIGTLTTKTITLNGTYLASDDNADGYSSITVNVQSGASMSEVQNTYGTGVIITSDSSSTPSLPSHTLYWEFEDNTNLTETVYYPSTFLSNAITATTPTTYNSKTVTLAQLDGATWYSYTPIPTPTPSGDWTTVYDGTVSGKGFTISELNSLAFAADETWRVTWDGTEYICSTVYGESWDIYYIGDINLANGGSGSADGEPFLLFNYNGGFGGYDTTEGTHTLKLEKQIVPSWEVIYNDTVELWEDKCYITELADLHFTEGETWRVTIDNVAYTCTVQYDLTYYVEYLGNANMFEDTSASGQYPFLINNGGSGALAVGIRNGGNNNHTLKLERQVSA